MHSTNAGEKRKALKRETKELEKEAKILANIRQMEPASRIRQDESNRLKAESEALKDQARLEDLHVWKMEKAKQTENGPKTYAYWMASWRDGDKTRNVHLGSCGKMSHAEASQKARAMKAKALATKL